MIWAISGQPLSVQVLPSDVTAAPRVFAKCLAMVAAHLRTGAIQVFPYLDN